MQSLRNNYVISVFTLHSSKFLNVIHKNCKYMHVDKDIHRSSYTSYSAWFPCTNNLCTVPEAGLGSIIIIFVDYDF